MGYEIVGGPFLLMETVAMLHKYVNGISFQAAISRQRFFMGNQDYQAQSAKMSRLQAIMEELCAKVESYATILPPLEKTPNPSVLPSS